MTITRVRTGQPQKVVLTVDELSMKQALALGKERLGLEVKVRKGGLSITKVQAGSHAARVGIRRGDQLLAMGGRRLRTLSEFEALVASLHDAPAVTVVIGRRGRAYYVTLELRISHRG